MSCKTTVLRAPRNVATAGPPGVDRAGQPTRFANVISHVSEVGWIVLVCFLFGSGLAPDVNEPHYLTKAKHFWDPSFAASDFFLSSRNAHGTYYWLFGWITTLVPLNVAAWVGRLAGWTLLAIGWQRLSWTLLPYRGASVFGAATWLSLVSCFQMSGEWIIGGVEAKVFAYAFVLLALAAWARGNAVMAYVWCGVGSALHVLVGGWAMILVLASQILLRSSDRPPFRQQAIGLILGGVLALWGLVPALQLNLGLPAETVRQATGIYVHGRLAHHLMIRDFPSLFVLRHVLLIACFLALVYCLAQRQTARRLTAFVWGSTALVVIGATVDAVIGHMPIGASIMRYYWFRASDIFMPLGVTLLGLEGLRQLTASRPMQGRLLTGLAATLSLANVGSTTWDLHGQEIPAADRQGKIASSAQLADWRDACEWVRRHTAPESRFLTPPDQQTFKWYAHRGEVVTWKDVPQDAAGLVEWSQRLKNVRAWRESESLDESEGRLRELRRAYDFQFVILDWPVSFPVPTLPVLYQNPRYRVCAVTPP